MFLGQICFIILVGHRLLLLRLRSLSDSYSFIADQKGNLTCQKRVAILDHTCRPLHDNRNQVNKNQSII